MVQAGLVGLVDQGGPTDLKVPLVLMDLAVHSGLVVPVARVARVVLEDLEDHQGPVFLVHHMDLEGL